jgi:hypothetical protein
VEGRTHQIEQRRTELEALIAAAEAEPPAPARHPHMASIFALKVRTLAAALHQDRPGSNSRLC